MTFWIYNVGLGVPISEKRLMSARKALPLEELTKSARLHGTDEESLKPSVNTGNTNHGYPKPNKGRAETGDAENIKSKLTTAYQPEKKHKITQPVQYAQEIMTKPVQSMNENIAFELAQEKFSKDKYRHYPVTNDNFNLVGILSDRDILRQAALNSTKSKVQQITVRDLMQRHVLTASLKATIKMFVG